MNNSNPEDAIFILDCNTLVSAFQATLANGRGFTNIAIGQLINAAMRSETINGRKIVIGLNWHIVSVVGTVLTKTREVATHAQYWAWIGQIMHDLDARGALHYDGTPSDYKALKVRAMSDDGCKDAVGNPDTEDEAVFEFVGARMRRFFHATFLTEESDEKLLTYARRRGIAVGNITALAAATPTGRRNTIRRREGPRAHFRCVAGRSVGRDVERAGMRARAHTAQLVADMLVQMEAVLDLFDGPPVG